MIFLWIYRLSTPYAGGPLTKIPADLFFWASSVVTSLPSALLTHSNIPIEEGETRYSIVQYSAEGLFRWVYNGFKSDKDFMASASPEQKVKREEDQKNRWFKALSMFTLWEDIRTKFS